MILTQLKAYKTSIIVVAFASLVIACGWLYHFDLEKAKSDLATLRTDLDTVNTQTEQLQNKLGLIPKPATNGTNAKDIQSKANEVSRDVFGRAK